MANVDFCVLMFKKIVIGTVYVIVMAVLGYAIVNILKSGAPKVINVTPTPTPTPYLFATLTPAQETEGEKTINAAAEAAVTAVPTLTNTPTPLPSDTPAPTATSTPVPEVTAASTPIPLPTATDTPTPVPTATNTPIPTSTNTPTPVPTATNTPVPTATNTPTPKPTATATPKPTSTPKPTATPAPTATATPKPSYSVVSGSQIVIDDFTGTSVVSGVTVSENSNDTLPFADIYNVGAGEGLKKSGLGKVVDGIKLSADDTLKANVISFSSSTGLGQLSGTAVIDGYDFSDYDFVVIYENLARDGSRILFRNCKFGSFKKGTSSIGTSVPFEFERCTFDTFVGANASFSECYIKGMSVDSLRFEKNITVSRCIFGDGSQRTEYSESETATLRVGSVYTDDKATHICLSNYTGKNRLLSVFTESGRVDFTIKPDGTAVCDTKTVTGVKVNKLSGSAAYGECLELIIPEKYSLVLCYDNTTSGKAVQIRFVNNTGKDVLLSKGLSRKLLGK